MNDEIYVFLDANVLLHYQQPDQIDWRVLCRAERVNLVVYPTLLTEVSDQKDKSPRRNIRDRAHKRETWLRERLNRLNEPIREGVFIMLDVQDADARALAKERDLDWQHKDDRVIAHAIGYARRSRRAVIVTNDFGMEVKARAAFAIEAFGLDRSLLLPAEPDPEKERADKAEREVRELRNRLPKLVVVPSEPIAVSLPSIAGTEEEFIQRRLAHAQEAYEHAERQRGIPGRPVVVYRLDPQHHSMHIAQVRGYLVAHYRWLAQADGAQLATIAVENVGNSPATNVRLRLRAPAFIRLFTRLTLGPAPSRPPVLPAVLSKLTVEMPRGPLGHQNVFNDASARRFSIVGTPNGAETSFERIAHAERVLAPELCFAATADAPPGDTAVSVSLYCDELGLPTEANIPIRVVDS